jgi:uncharacterized protein
MCSCSTGAELKVSSDRNPTLVSSWAKRSGSRTARGQGQAGPVGEGTLTRMDADAVEIRVLGCLIEKQRTTPDIYPLSLNALRAACNQSTNRDPVVSYDEETIRAALARLGRKGWTRLASGPGSRAVKYRHLLADALGLNDADLALLAVLLLRGPQTAGELRARSERLHPFASAAELEAALESLGARGLAARLSRRPGEKGERWTQLLGGVDAEGAGRTAAAPLEPRRSGDSLEERVSRLEEELASLREMVESAAPRGSVNPRRA